MAAVYSISYIESEFTIRTTSGFCVVFSIFKKLFVGITAAVVVVLEMEEIRFRSMYVLSFLNMSR